MIQETEELIAGIMVTGSYSNGLVSELDDHIEHRGLHVHKILDEIAVLSRSG